MRRSGVRIPSAPPEAEGPDHQVGAFAVPTPPAHPPAGQPRSATSRRPRPFPRAAQLHQFSPPSAPARARLHRDGVRARPGADAVGVECARARRARAPSSSPRDPSRPRDPSPLRDPSRPVLSPPGTRPRPASALVRARVHRYGVRGRSWAGAVGLGARMRRARAPSTCPATRASPVLSLPGARSRPASAVVRTRVHRYGGRGRGGACAVGVGECAGATSVWGRRAVGTTSVWLRRARAASSYLRPLVVCVPELGVLVARSWWRVRSFVGECTVTAGAVGMERAQSGRGSARARRACEDDERVGTTSVWGRRACGDDERVGTTGVWGRRACGDDGRALSRRAGASSSCRAGCPTVRVGGECGRSWASAALRRARSGWSVRSRWRSAWGVGDAWWEW